MKHIRRIISFLLALAMVTGMVPPMGVSAEETESAQFVTEATEDSFFPEEQVTEPIEDSTAPIQTSAESAHELVSSGAMMSSVASGTCGDNLTWTLDDEGTLTISGTGEMDYYAFSNEVPWYSHTYSITEVSLPEGLGSIARYAFANCRNLKSITIPESVYIIYSNAFLYSGITSLTIPKNVADIDMSCFQACYDLEEITVDPENEYFYSVDGIMFSKDLSTLRYYPSGMSAESYAVPDHVTTIGKQAFMSCANLKHLELPAELTTIGFGAFLSASLEAILIPASVDDIAGYAFNSCDQLSHVYYTGTTEQWNALLKNNLGPDNDSLLNAAIHCNWDGSGIPENPGPTDPSEPSSPTEPEDDTISGTCGDNLSWTLKDNVLTISGTGAMTDFAYDGAPWLGNAVLKIVLPDGLTAIGDYAFQSSLISNIDIPGTVRHIGQGAFFYCDKLKSVEIPDGISSIANDTFGYCRSMTSISIPESVTSIGTGAFYYCSSLKNIEIPVGITSIANNTFYHCNGLTGIKIPDGVTDIGDGAFNQCSSLAEIEIPASVTSIGEMAFMGCESLVSVDIPDGVTEIKGSTFSSCNKLESIGIPSSVSAIGIAAFRGCTGLKTVSIPNGVQSIGNQAFNNCSSLESITIADSVTSIGQSAFSECSSLVNITIPNSVTVLGANMFYSCSSLVSATMSAGLTEIPYNMFYNCTKLKSVTIPDTVTRIGMGAFKNCSSLSDIKIPSGMTWIDSETFSGCSSLNDIEIPSNITSIYTKAFYNCSGLTDITISPNLYTIQSEVFYGCSNLTDVYYTGNEGQWKALTSRMSSGNDSILNATVHYDNAEAITGTCGENLTWKLKGSTLTISGAGAMTDYGSREDVPWHQYRAEITKIFLPEGLTSICRDAFASCTYLTSVTLPESLTAIDGGAFSWSGLTGITIPASVTNIASGVFQSCNSLAAIQVDADNPNYCDIEGVLFSKDGTVLHTYPGGATAENYSVPAGTTTLGTSAFMGCHNLIDLSLPEGLTTIYGSFYCNSLTSILLPKSVTFIGNYTFLNTPVFSTVYYAGTQEQWQTLVAQGIKDGNQSLLTATVHCNWTQPDTPEAPLGGICGQNLTWRLENGILTISGTGSMEGYPWRAYASQITVLIISEGVTSISYAAFANLNGVTEVIIPASVTTINAQAFQGLQGLTYVEIQGPAQLESCAFDSCSQLKTVILHKEIPSVANRAFGYCSGLTDVYFTGTEAEWADFLTTKVQSGNEALRNASNIVFNYGTSEQIIDTKDPNPATVMIDQPVEILVSGIPENADRVVLYLDGVEIGTVNAGGVTEKSFYYTFHTFGQHTLTANAFTGEGSVKLSWEKPVIVTGIRLTADRESAWTGETVNFTVEVYPDAGAVDFYAEDLLFASVALTENTGVLAHAFTMAGDRQISVRTGDGLVSRTLTLPIQCVGQLVQPVLEAESTQYVANGLVCSWNTTDNTDAYVLRVRTADGREVLQRNISDDGSVRMTCSISAEELGGAGTYELYLMNSGYQYDQNESATITVEFVESDVLIAEGTCGPTATWTLNESGTLTISGSGMVSSAPWLESHTAQIISVAVADGITDLCEGVFLNCAALKKIVVPASLISIRASAFYGCTAITSAGPTGSGADYEFGWTTEIPASAFQYLKNLTKITWPTGLVTIHADAFIECGFTKLIIPEGVTSIGANAFMSCTGLKRLALPTTLTTTGSYAFANCTALEDVFVMSQGLTIGSNAFQYCTALSNVFYAVSEEKIGNISGNQTLLRAANVYYDWTDAMETQVLIMRHINYKSEGRNTGWMNAITERHTLSKASFERVDLRVILGMHDIYDTASTIWLYCNGYDVWDEDDGRFENLRFCPGFGKNAVFSVHIPDCNGNTIYEEKLSLRIVEGYTVTFVYWNLESGAQYTVSEKFRDGASINIPDTPGREGYTLTGWYASEKMDGFDFFSQENKWNRILLDDDITLYAKWINETHKQELTRQDVWSFDNFADDSYEMTSRDYQTLVEGLDDEKLQLCLNYMNGDPTGSCIGMASIVVLAKSGDFDISKFDPSAKTLSEASLDVDNVKSAINFYQVRASFGKLRELLNDYSDISTNLKKIVKTMQKKREPVVLNVRIGRGSLAPTHTVVAFNLRETETGYQFYVYDPNDPSMFFPVNILNNDGVYTKECSLWEEKTGNTFVFLTCVTSDDLKKDKMITIPDEASRVFSISSDTESANYLLETTYDSFTITSQAGTAEISDGQTVSGNLEIFCCGNISEPGYSPKYQFYLPVLFNGDAYSITQNTSEQLKTILYYENTQDGFFMKEEATQPGEIRFSADGNVSTRYSEKTNHTLKVTTNNMQTPWHGVEICGESTGFYMDPAVDSVSLHSETDTTVTVKTNGAFNSTSISEVHITADPILVEEGENTSCIITKNGITIASSHYGYSVLFNSNLGTNVESLQNVQSGSLIPEPAAPTRAGYLFEGWFTDDEFTTLWDFSADTVTEDLILYAGWSVDPNYMKSVTFRMSGKDDQIVYMPVNSLIPADYVPTATDGETILWFADRACTELWNFETDTLTSSLTLYGQVEKRVTVDIADLDVQTSVWIDGAEYMVQTDGDNAYIDLPDGNATSMIAYTYHVGDSSDIHTQYPVSMKVWTLKNEYGFYTATRAYELDNIFQYSGSSIRVTGKQGIRMITSIEKGKKDSLISDGLAGYTLKEYGTVVAWASQLGDSNPLILGQSYAKSNYAYKKGIADPVFAYEGSLMQYTNVLVGFSDAQCKEDLSMRPYMILQDAEGNEITLYGGIVTRSIGYIALQNKDYFDVGTEAYEYVWSIIHHVYGDAYAA